MESLEQRRGTFALRGEGRTQSNKSPERSGTSTAAPVGIAPKAIIGYTAATFLFIACLTRLRFVLFKSLNVTAVTDAPQKGIAASKLYWKMDEGATHATIEGRNRSAPFELDATTWNIDSTVFAQMWAEAQSHLGLAIDATDKQRYDILKNWNLDSQARGDPIFDNITFILVSKSGSEEIAANLRKWKKKATSTSSKKCTIAFVRDPFARFISGYVEFEWRFEQARKKYNDTMALPKYKFHEYKLGSEQRAAAFVRDLVSFKVLDWLHELPPNLDWFDKHLNENPLLFHRGAIAHLCPLVGRLRGKKIDFLGQLEHMSRDWKLMTDHCKIKNLGTFHRSLASHITSKDPQRTKRAIEKALAGDCHLKTAVCLLLKADYDILSQHFDYKCTGCNNKIIHQLSR